MSVFTDNFNRANGALDATGIPWVDQVAGLEVVGTHAVASASPTEQFSYYDTPTPDDHYAKALLAASNTYGGVSVRASGTGATFNAYRYVSNTVDAQGISKWVSGSVTTLASASATPNVNDELYLDVVGSQLTAKINGSQVATVSDGALPSGHFGIMALATGQVDNFEGGFTDTEGFLLVAN